MVVIYVLEMKIRPHLIVLLLLFTLLPASAAESIWISSPSDGVTFGDETITLYAQVSNSSMSVPFIKYSHDPSEAPPMTYWGSNIYIYNVNFSEFPDGPWSILVSSGIYTDAINITKESTTTTPTPTPTPESIKYLHITGLEDGDTHDNSSLFFIVYDNETREPINQPMWNLWHQNRIVNSGTGYYSGRCNIEWIDDFGQSLDDGAYLIQIRSDGYEPTEFLVSLKSPEPPTETDESMSIFGVDKQVADDVTLWIYVMDKSDNDMYLEDVTVKVLDQDGTTITSLVTDINGRVLINWQEITDLAMGDYAYYAVEFTKPGYKRKVVDTTVVSSIPTPTPTPTSTPTPTPVSTPDPAQTTSPSVTPVSATTQDDENKANSNLPTPLIFFSAMVGMGMLFFTVVFPDKTKVIRDSVFGTVKENGRRMSKTNRVQDLIICKATDTDPRTHTETKCQSPVVPGTHYCRQHQHLATNSQAAQPPPAQPPSEVMKAHSIEPLVEQGDINHTWGLKEDEQDPDYDDILMDPAVVRQALKMVLDNTGDDDIKALIMEQHGITPPDSWLEKVHSEVDHMVDNTDPEQGADST